MSIYETIGGKRSIADAVESFYAKLRADPIIAGYFEGTDPARLQTQQEMFLTAALGGPDAYKGRDMRAAHAHLAITDADFDLFLQHLSETLVEIGTDSGRIEQVLEALEPLRHDIVHAPAEGADDWGSEDPSGGSG